jgi:hypothetical protein
MAIGDIVIIILIFSGCILCCVTNYMCCSEEDFTMRPVEPLQNKDTTSVVVIQEI